MLSQLFFPKQFVILVEILAVTLELEEFQSITVINRNVACNTNFGTKQKNLIIHSYQCYKSKSKTLAFLRQPPVKTHEILKLLVESQKSHQKTLEKIANLLKEAQEEQRTIMKENQQIQMKLMREMHQKNLQTIENLEKKIVDTIGNLEKKLVDTIENLEKKMLTAFWKQRSMFQLILIFFFFIYLT